MRWVVYALLAVNLGLLTWNLQTRGSNPPAPQPAATTQAPTPDENAQRLPLLTELAKDSLRERPPVGAGLPANPPPDFTPTPTLTTPSSPSASSEAPKPADPPPPTTAETRPLADSRACLTLGPLDATAPLAAIQAWLEQRGAKVDVRTGERREVALYWIYFPPKPTRAEAVTQVERMRGEGIGDVIVVLKGDMANAISLGVFSRADTRDRRLRELNAKGYQPSISPRYRTTLATWVDASAPQDAISDAELQARWPELELARKPCASAQIAATTPPSYNPGEAPRPERRFIYSGQVPGQAPGAGSGTR